MEFITYATGNIYSNNKKKKLSTLRFFKSYQKMKRKEKERKKERIAKEKVQCAIE